MKQFNDLYQDKYMHITFCSPKSEKLYENYIDRHLIGDYGNVKRIFEKYEATTAFYIQNINETCIDVPDGWVIIDSYGEVAGAGGKYEVFLDIFSSVKKLNLTMMQDRKDIYSGKYDLIYAMELIDISLMKENKLLFTQAQEIYLIMKNIPKWKKELCKLGGEDYDGGLDKMFDHVKRNAIDYAGIRAKFAVLSDAEAVRRNNEQIAAQNLFIDSMITFLEQGKCFATPEQEDQLDDLDGKQLGDLGVYIAYTQAMNAR